VFVASICGRVALPAFGPYTVSKFAVEAYADTVRRELAPFGVHVSIVEPGFHRTAITQVSSSAALLDRSWSRATKEVRSEYGEEFMQKRGFL